MIHIPQHWPGLRPFLFVLGLLLAVWSTLEGNLPRVVGLGLLVCLMSILLIWQRWLAQRPFSLGVWLIITAVSGLMGGLLLGPIVWLLMILKTGIHAHGPEFSPQQIAWVVQQIPLWLIVGGIAGTGVGLITFAVWRENN